jgi:hypothetical protein
MLHMRRFCSIVAHESLCGVPLTELLRTAKHAAYRSVGCTDSACAAPIPLRKGS